MKNIITMAIILILPILVYTILTKGNSDISAVAKNKDLPTIMIFSSSMCVDCQKMKSILNDVQGDYKEKINFVSINATEKDKKIKDLVKKYNIVLVPTMVFLDLNENEINRVEGYIPKEELISEIEEAING